MVIFLYFCRKIKDLSMKRNIKTFYTLLYLVGFICFWLMPLQASGSIKLDGERLSAKDGLSCNTVNDIIQDRDGFIWLGTPNGVSRYDGYQFINFTNLSKNSGQKTHHSISQLINDEKHGLIWGYNPSNILCCFDLETAHFSDYFDKENAALLRNRFKSQNGMWLFSGDFGARYLTYSNGKFHATDYTTKNGKLIGDHQLQMQEDFKHNIWIASDKGLNRITPDGKSHLMLKNQHIITLTTDGNHIAVLTDKGDAFLYDNSGKPVRKSHLPSMVGYVGKSRASFFCQGEWYIFTQEETFAMNLKTGIFHKPAIQIPNAMSKTFLKSYEFLYDKKGNAYLFSKKGNLFRKFHLLDDKAYINGRDKNFVDDYMVKPCNFKLLIARALQFVAMDLKAKQQAEEKAKLQEETLQENAPQENPEQTSGGEAILIKPVKELKKNEPTLLMSTLDKKFKDKLEAIVAQHIGDNNFNVDRLAELLCLGRTTVYNRTKSIMGVSPNIYIQNERLRIAAKLLLEGEYTVSEISEKVGFSDSTYFYKCFKNKYGIAPSKYGK